ncbi:MAG: hypothetical protein NVS3B5_05950 [Sphingomicrobium sp.]
MPPGEHSASVGERYPWLIPALLFLVALAARAQTFGNPVLGYDEQFYLLVGDRMLHGAVPFVDIFDRKPIGLFLIYGGIRLLGGEGTLQYQLVAMLFAWSTALLVWRFARRLTTEPGAVAAAIAYLVWLDFMEGEGGQSPVFFNLPMIGAAMLVERLVRQRSVTAKAGALPMLLVGAAIQIKYTALFEGVFFGCALLWIARRERNEPARIMGLAAIWGSAALAPTLAAYLAYLLKGSGEEFLFANFISMWGKLPDPAMTNIVGVLTIIGIIAPFLACAAFAPPPSDTQQAASRRFVIQWLVAAIIGMLAMRSFSTPQYAMPVLLPAALAAAPRLGMPGTSRRIMWIVMVVAFAISQFVLSSLQTLKGRAPEAAMMAQAATPKHGCLFVYDGYPALYRLTHGCALSRFVFPGHLNMMNEGSAAALGVDPNQEVRRIMGLRPETVTMDDPPFERVNRATYAIMEQELARHYRLDFTMRTGVRRRLVYRRAS